MSQDEDGANDAEAAGGTPGGAHGNGTNGNGTHGNGTNGGTNGGVVGRRDWRRLRDMGVATLAWTAVLGIVLWALAHVVGSLLLFILAAILAYALSPAVKHLERFMPRAFAIALVYLGILTTLSGLIYLIIITAVGQVSMLLKDVQSLLAAGPNGEESPLVAMFKAVGLTDAQIQSAAARMLGQVQGLTGDAVAVAASVLDAVVRTVLVGVLSIYLLKDGPRVVGWLRTNTPIAQRPRIVFFVDTLDTVVGGYIRGQLTLSALIGVLVGGGMWLFHVPYAVFLGVLAFVLEFVPIVGVFISGAICVVLALTQGVGVAIVVLAYFVLVHFIEGDIVGPRIMSKAVGLHPAISILALIAGSELFGIWGALFAAPVTGLIQAVIRTIWLEWRESHPEQFPTGYTVEPDVRIVPVTHAETPPATTVEPAEAAQLGVAPPDPLRPDPPSIREAPVPSPGGELVPLDAAPERANGDGRAGEPVAAEDPADPVPTPPDDARLLPDVSAWVPAPPAASLYDRFVAPDAAASGLDGERPPNGRAQDVGRGRDGAGDGEGDGDGPSAAGPAEGPANGRGRHRERPRGRGRANGRVNGRGGVAKGAAGPGGGEAHGDAADGAGEP